MLCATNLECRGNLVGAVLNNALSFNCSVAPRVVLATVLLNQHSSHSCQATRHPACETPTHARQFRRDSDNMAIPDGLSLSDWNIYCSELVQGYDWAWKLSRKYRNS